MSRHQKALLMLVLSLVASPAASLHSTRRLTADYLLQKASGVVQTETSEGNVDTAETSAAANIEDSSSGTLSASGEEAPAKAEGSEEMPAPQTESQEPSAPSLEQDMEVPEIDSVLALQADAPVATIDLTTEDEDPSMEVAASTVLMQASISLQRSSGAPRSNKDMEL
mmetsp:Transcript_51764/g.123184  ORF Transcript_51764/g.123184 Transcript_51764/m.123184 type:complete len:168 (+) Transcript_51764:128-631(+)|eukprot:CAMPEP_0178437852 /NCGR_PEP_ID=MMETSP0689_2-20121128/35237_1 /TAXON_ID=160604 /ORGANISM="Amphidinium massartii, Strain CS-259" /LENGTH=167 /DNA_ID=CAMNT_0020060129 /DNA_START=127 /DNA_END=630 /DNA_ORIENTATION=-